ncbi:unnamed protein product, partial [Ectocarpus sp. 12 AP-2014]
MYCVMMLRMGVGRPGSNVDSARRLGECTCTTVIYAAMKSYFARTFLLLCAFQRQGALLMKLAVMPPPLPLPCVCLCFRMASTSAGFLSRETHDRSLFRWLF